MISLKRKQKTGELVKATGVTEQEWRIYKPNQTDDYPISRSRFDDFMNCKRCFYLKVNKGFMSPSTPGWTLNTLTDTLLKKEFDECRKKQKPHRIMVDYGLNHMVPYVSEKIKDKTNFFAKRFAAKEAFIKSIGTGIRKGINFKDIYVINDKSGKPNLKFSNKVKNIMIKKFKTKTFNLFISLSDEKNYSIAFVIIQKK